MPRLLSALGRIGSCPLSGAEDDGRYRVDVPAARLTAKGRSGHVRFEAPSRMAGFRHSEPDLADRKGRNGKLHPRQLNGRFER
jgi:hypothetical protein